MTDPALIKLLKEELELLDKAAIRLKSSYDECSSLDFSSGLDEKDLVLCEALVSRFARLSDYLVKNIFRLIASIELLEPESFIDVLNFAEKHRLLSSAESYRAIRKLRNQIVHEYQDSEYLQIIRDVIVRAPELDDAIAKTAIYCRKYF